ncbi:alpha/beta-type small acid-soluble spore protein [Maledivibacter halophilus]|uniref:Small, acid-soluble spore protein, alpha/beta type n=1 Tax=Maledivibacter halophilus TaxID=36842 RepID=A0A1T5JS19_9FIRM|nr:alpha/beta-type small acid-soluble spore protein [Maledivibacter halophilus]SKC54200.1 Small, acid-soluble spore protein, alpha/beta type [Maledivibacter halophilus]
MANRPIDPNAREALKKMKMEISNELGLKGIPEGDKGNLTSRKNGSYGGDLGGTMTRKLIEMAERELMKES